MHRVVWRQETKYPFAKFWACVCGTRMEATIMGPDLYREFAQHQEENPVD